MQTDVTPTNINPFESLNRSLGHNYFDCAKDVVGWRAEATWHRESTATKLIKEVPDTGNEIRLLRWVGEAGKFRYALEVGPCGNPQALSHGEGLAIGDNKFRAPFEDAFRNISGG